MGPTLKNTRRANKFLKWLKRGKTEQLKLEVSFPKVYSFILQGLVPCSRTKKTYMVQYVLITFYDEWVDGWMTCDFTSFLTVYQSCQDDVG